MSDTPTNWNQLYQNNDTHWDRGQSSPPLTHYVTEHPLAGRVFVPGCGTGHDVAMLAAKGLQVTGLDIAPLALEKARANYPTLPAETWLLGDLFALPAELEGQFDAVTEHTCLCALPPSMRVAYRDAVAKLLRPGGLLIGVWFINPDLDPGETGPPFAIPVSELDALFAEKFEIVEDYVPTAAYAGREGRERIRVLRKR